MATEPESNAVWVVSLRAHGHVQGVFFRASTQELSIRLGLTGTVRNCADTSVEITAFGSRGSLTELIEWVRGGGPPNASVASVEYLQDLQEAKGSAVPRFFEILRG